MAVEAPVAEQLTPVKRRSAIVETWENIRHSKAGMIGLSLIVIHLILAITSPVIVPHDPLAMSAPDRNLAPSLEHPFGTDKLGRDVFSRSLMGGRVALVVTLIAIGLAVIWGGLVGILLGFIGGRTDEIVMRVVDALLSIPWLLLLLLIIAILGTNMRELFQMKVYNLSVAVWVGFIALFGIATDDGVVVATYLKQSFERHTPENVKEVRMAVLEAGKKRVLPAMMTTATTLLALLPVLTSSGRGSDIMIPMAIPSFGGMCVALLTMLVVPVLYSAYEERRIPKSK